MKTISYLGLMVLIVRLRIRLHRSNKRITSILNNI